MHPILCRIDMRRCSVWRIKTRKLQRIKTRKLRTKTRKLQPAMSKLTTIYCKRSTRFCLWEEKKIVPGCEATRCRALQQKPSKGQSSIRSWCYDDRIPKRNISGHFWIDKEEFTVLPHPLLQVVWVFQALTETSTGTYPATRFCLFQVFNPSNAKGTQQSLPLLTR